MNPLAEYKPTFFIVEERGDVTVLRLCRPSLSEEDNIEQLAQELSTIVDHYGCRKVVVCFQAVTLITSAALGKFIALHRNLHRKSGCLAVCGVSGMVKDVLRTTKLNEYFKVTESVDDAVTLLSA